MFEKKILLITEGLTSGGAERQICGLASMLTERGFKCRLITYSDTHFYEQWLRDHHVDYEYVPSLLNKWTRIFRLVCYLHVYKPDVVISYLPSVNITCCLSCFFFNCFLIVSERNNNTGLSKKDILQFNLYRKANVIVPNSYCQGKFIENNFPSLRDKVVPIINFVDVDYFKPNERKDENEVLQIVTAARYTDQKNCIKYLEAVKRVKDLGLRVHFQWFGNKQYDPSYYALVEEKAKELNVLDYVTLNAENNHILDVYQSADIFMLPSLFEGYPNVIVEAMACELPILCGRVYENPFIVEEDVNGMLFNPVDVDEMVQAVKRMVELEPQKRKEMGELNRKKCLKYNTEQQFVERYIKIIENE